MWIKSVTGLLMLLVGLSSCSSEKTGDQTDTGNGLSGIGGEISFEKSEHDMGTVMQGEKVGYNFVFTNTGEGSLMILDASTSCGCTVPRFSDEPVPPDGSGTVEVVFDSSGRMGKQNKTVTIRTNGKTRVVKLTIRANIINSNS